MSRFCCGNTIARVAGEHADSAREFRYLDGGRARHVWRELTRDPEAEEQGNDPFDGENPWTGIGDWHWTDYDGVEPYADSTIAAGGGSGTPSVAEKTRYFGGMAHQTLGSGGVTRYWHGDLTGSTNLLTDTSGAAGSPASKLAYSAFGELVGTIPSDFPRYQYDGAHAYESGLLSLAGASGTAPITLQHVGARWYQPGIGRFVQRDPIGSAGGINTYVYLENEPLGRVDPTGLFPEIPIGDPSPNNPGPFPLPPGGRHIVWRPVSPAPLPWYRVPATISTSTLGAVCVAAAVGAVAGTVLNELHPGSNQRYSDSVGEWICDTLCPRPAGMPTGYKPY